MNRPRASSRRCSRSDGVRWAGAALARSSRPAVNGRSNSRSRASSSRSSILWSVVCVVPASASTAPSTAVATLAHASLFGRSPRTNARTAVEASAEITAVKGSMSGTRHLHVATDSARKLQALHHEIQRLDVATPSLVIGRFSLVPPSFRMPTVTDVRISSLASRNLGLFAHHAQLLLVSEKPILFAETGHECAE